MPFEVLDCAILRFPRQTVKSFSLTFFYSILAGDYSKSRSEDNTITFACYSNYFIVILVVTVFGVLSFSLVF